MRRLIGIRLSGIALALGWVSAGTSLAAPPQTVAGIDAIRAYEGTWNISIEHFDTAQSKAGMEKTILRNECWKSGGYFACNQFVNGESKVLIVFTYNPKDKTYTSSQVPPDGGEPGSGKLLIDGNVWTFPWQQGQGDGTIWFRVVNVFTSPDRIEYRQEFSTDKVHWIITAKGVETKGRAK